MIGIGDVRLGFLGDRVIGERPASDQEDQDRQREPRVANGEA